MIDSFGIRLLPSQDPKGRTVLYEEPGHSLELFFELTGFTIPYDWVGGIESFSEWTLPQGKPIEDGHGKLIRARVEAWARATSFSIGFERPLTQDELDGRFIAKGYTRTVRADGSILWTAPSRTGVLGWFAGLFR